MDTPEQGRLRTRIKTDTATVVVFDPDRMKHRLADDADWWSVPDEEVPEINRGNVLFVTLGADGVYDLEVTGESPEIGSPGVSALLRNESGRLFVGAGEYVTSDGLEPEAVYGNVFIYCSPGVYRATVQRSGWTVFVHVVPADGPATNDFTDSPRLV